MTGKVLLYQKNLTGKLYCVLGSSNFDTAFLPDCIKFWSVFWSSWI